MCKALVIFSVFVRGVSALGESHASETVEFTLRNPSSASKETSHGDRKDDKGDDKKSDDDDDDDDDNNDPGVYKWNPLLDIYQ